MNSTICYSRRLTILINVLTRLHARSAVKIAMKRQGMGLAYSQSGR